MPDDQNITNHYTNNGKDFVSIKNLGNWERENNGTNAPPQSHETWREYEIRKNGQ